jgi:hypothetical protein
MKLNIIVNKMGDAVGAFQSEPVKLEDGSELRAGVMADPDKTIREIEVPDTLVRQPTAKVQEEIQKIADEKFGLKPYMKKNWEKVSKR